MPLGFSVGDLIAVGDLAYRLYSDVHKVSRSAPAEVKELERELGAVSNATKILVAEAKDLQSLPCKAGAQRVDSINQMMANTKTVLENLAKHFDIYKSVDDPATKKLKKRARVVQGQIHWRCGSHQRTMSKTRLPR